MGIGATAGPHQHRHRTTDRRTDTSDLGAIGWTKQPAVDWILTTAALAEPSANTVALSVSPAELLHDKTAMESGPGQDRRHRPLRPPGALGRRSTGLDDPARTSTSRPTELGRTRASHRQDGESMTTTQDLTERNAAFASKGFVSGLTINPRGNRMLSDAAIHALTQATCSGATTVKPPLSATWAA